MLLKNLDTNVGLANGARGVVTGFVDEDGGSLRLPKVLFSLGCGDGGGQEKELTRIISMEEWSSGSGDEECSRAQLPLRLAWSLTVFFISLPLLLSFSHAVYFLVFFSYILGAQSTRADNQPSPCQPYRLF